MNAQQHHGLRAISAIVLAMVFTGVAGVPQGPVQQHTPGLGAKHQVLQEAVQAEGTARVLVRFAVDAATSPAPERAPRGQMAGGAPSTKGQQLAERKRAVAQAHQRFVQRHNLAPGQAKGFSFVPYAAVEVDAALLAELAASPDVLDITPDDFNELSLASTRSVIGADVAQASGWDGTGYDVAILDTGVDSDHPMLQDNIVPDTAACYSNAIYAYDVSLCPSGFNQCRDSNGSPISESACGDGAAEACDSKCGHGSHVAGIAAGNGSEVGVAPGAGIIPVNVFIGRDMDGNGSVDLVGAYDSDIIRGLEHVLRLAQTRDIAAVNMSLGGGIYSTTAQCDSWESATKAVVDDLRALGVATVVAAGNNGSSEGLSSPGCISSVISVGSTNDSDSISSFSNETPAMTLHAPGESVKSAYLKGEMKWMNGTSMAAPHVAGAAAVLRQKAGFEGVDLSVDHIIAALQQTGAAMYGGAYRVPRIDLAAAADAVDATPPITVIVDDQLHNGAVTVVDGELSVKNDPDGYGGQALQGDTAAAPNVVRFSPDLPTAGFYTVSATWPVLSGNGSAIDATVSHSGGVDTFVLNQTTGSARWQALGTFFFEAGQGAYVDLSDASGGRLVADAVRFEHDGAGLAIATQQLPVAVLGQDYSTVLAASGGLPPYSWSIVDGSLPAGLSLDAARGEIAGAAAESGNFLVTVAVADAQGTVATQALTMAVEAPVSISGAITADSALANLNMVASDGANCAVADDNGSYSCTVPQGWSGNVWPSATGYSFEPASRSYTDVQADLVAEDYAAIAMDDTVWIEDADPASMRLYSEYGWGWSESGLVSPYSGNRAVYSPVNSGEHRHAANGASAAESLTVEAGDRLYVYVWLDPENMPRSLMLTFQDDSGLASSGDHRPYWGEDLILHRLGGEVGTAARLPMGDLPSAGGWVRLEVPAADLNLEGETLISYGVYAYGGRLAFDQLGKSSVPVEPVTGYSISGQVTSGGVGLSGIEMASADGAVCTATDANGDYSCEVTQGWSGSIAPTASGYSVEPAQRTFADVQSDVTAQDFTATAVASQDTVWIEDADPASMRLYSEYGWGWSESGLVSPYSGNRAVYSPVNSGEHRHAANGASAAESLTVEAGDRLYVYVWLDPENMPRSLMLTFQDDSGLASSGDHRPYWGEDLILHRLGGEVGTAARLPMGDLPSAGGWVRLEVPAADLNLEGETLISYGVYAYGGRLAFDQLGKSNQP
ncbi:hypothetical protein CKO31_14330 [Thiohalocapsa halophila]|uniref:PKD domain-containing protein n=1 Tax=Thiohalocapsa halophila TaxID=69359 RepID=A0ABS1CJ02_9GAMM|nr:S8 family serine peptidase [Thiohalocapsa halophila]MBK1631891.1 hypothetical protein [Thiohalocapsa halophila]